MNGDAAEGRKFMINLKNSMGTIEGATRNTAQAIQELSTKSGEIGKITHATCPSPTDLAI